MGSKIANDIINLKEHKQMLEAECGTASYDPHIFSKNQRSEMEREIVSGNP